MFIYLLCRGRFKHILFQNIKELGQIQTHQRNVSNVLLKLIFACNAQQTMNAHNVLRVNICHMIKNHVRMIVLQ